MNNETAKVYIAGERFDFDTVLCAGITEDDAPVSFYTGPADLDEIHNILYYTNRTVIRTLIKEFDIPLDDMDDFFLSAISEAFTKEWNAMNHTGHKKISFHKITKLRGFDQ